MTSGLLAGSLLCVHFVAEQQLTIGDFVLFGSLGLFINGSICAITSIIFFFLKELISCNFTRH